MNIKRIIPAFVAMLAMLVSCSEEFEPTFLDEVQVSSSYVTFAADGSTTKVDVTAKGDWKVIDLPEWVTVNPASGSAGSTTVSFTAEAAKESREAVCHIECNGVKQNINLYQQTEKVELPISSCADVIAGPDSKSYRVKGICTKIANTQYGNWYIQDETGEVYIYGTVDGTGAYNWSSFGIEVGDEVTVEGPKTTYNGTVELVDVTVVNVSKSLIKIASLDPEDATLPLEGGDFTVTLENKGQGVSVVIPENAKEWLSVTGISTGATSVVKFHAAANAGGDRTCDLVFTTTDGKKEYTATTSLTQKGAIIAVNVADFNAAEKGNTVYRIQAVVSSIANADKGRFYIKDFSGETYVYNCSDMKGIKVGDIITITGKRDQYNETIEMTSATIEEVQAVESISLADFNNLSDDKNKYYMIEGTVGKPTGEGTKYDLETYGNFGLFDAAGAEVYVYGCTQGWNGPSKMFGTLGVKEGDKLTMIAYKTSYKGTNEAVGFYFSHEAK